MPGLERIRCPHCGSNCFPGSDRCWNCGSSLPPPECVSPTTPAGARERACPMERPGFGGAKTALAVVAIMLVCVAGIYALLQSHAASGVRRRQAQLEAIKERLMRERFHGGSGIPIAPPADPTEAEARRELDRLRGQLDSMARPAPGSDIRLRWEQQPR